MNGLQRYVLAGFLIGLVVFTMMSVAWWRLF